MKGLKKLREKPKGFFSREGKKRQRTSTSNSPPWPIMWNGELKICWSVNEMLEVPLNPEGMGK